MRVLITGGCGMLGRKLLDALLARGTLSDADGKQREITSIRIADIAAPAVPLPDDARVEGVFGDLTAPGAIDSIVDGGVDAVIHLAAIVSGEAERDFDKGYAINLDGTRALLEACRHQNNVPRFVFTSSLATYGGDMPDVIEDTTALMPQTSYGAHKAMGELLVHDYARKGFVDGRAMRLPTIVVRPGRPNAAASSFASSIIREPLNGENAVCPVPQRLPLWLLSPRQVTRSMLHALDSPASGWRSFAALAIPGITVTVREMLAALADVAGENVAGRVRFEPDNFVTKIVGGWPAHFAPKRALAMGFEADASFHTIIEAFIEDEGVAQAPD